MLCDSLVLSSFNFCDVIYGFCIDSIDARRIQTFKIHLFIYGIRRRDRISHTLSKTKWLTMRDRRLVHSLCLFHNIISSKLPGYLYDRLTFRTDVHNLNIRYRSLLTPPLHKYEIFKRSFSYNIVKLYNNLPVNFKQLHPLNFKRHVVNHFLAGLFIPIYHWCLSVHIVSFVSLATFLATLLMSLRGPYCTYGTYFSICIVV